MTEFSSLIVLDLGNPIEGTEEGVKSIAIGDLDAFRNAHIVKSNVVVVGAGPIDHESLIQSTTSGFSSLSNSQPPPITSTVFVGSDIDMRFDSMRVRPSPCF